MNRLVLTGLPVGASLKSSVFDYLGRGKRTRIGDAIIFPILHVPLLLGRLCIRNRFHLLDRKEMSSLKLTMAPSEGWDAARATVVRASISVKDSGQPRIPTYFSGSGHVLAFRVGRNKTD
jgi:hypothetical protein